MNIIFSIFKSVSRLLRHFGACGNAGLIVGSIAGSMLVLLYLASAGNLSPLPVELLYITLLLTVFSWAVLLFISIVLLRNTPTSMFFPTLIHAFLICALTVYLCSAFNLYKYGWIIGVLAGLFVGYVLCTMFKRILG